MSCFNLEEANIDIYQQLYDLYEKASHPHCHCTTWPLLKPLLRSLKAIISHGLLLCFSEHARTVFWDLAKGM